MQGSRRPVRMSLPGAFPEVPRRFLEALRHGRFDELGTLFAPDMWLRNLLTRTVHESNTVVAAVEAFRGWVGTPHGRRMLQAEHHPMAGREFIRYRFLLRPAWAPERWHVIEQSGYCRVQDGVISRMDLACTGYFPVEADSP